MVGDMRVYGIGALASVYKYILGPEWGCNKPNQNQDADSATVNDPDRLLTERVGEPRSLNNIPEVKGGGDEVSN